MKLIRLAAALAVGVFVSGAAQAATYTSNGNCTLSDISPAAVSCYGSAMGNPLDVNLNGGVFDGTTGLFGDNIWTYIESNPTFNGGDYGSFTVGQHDYSTVAVILKYGGQFAAYKLNDWFGGVISYTTTNGSGLTNYVVAGLNPAPLPAAGWLLLAGFGGLAMVRRRGKAAA